MAKNLWKIEPREAPDPDTGGSVGTAAASASPAPESVGAILRERREERGEDLRYVAQMLRIRYPYLKAIEEGLIGELPGPTYAIGFVRTYAEHLELDVPDMVARFKAEVQGFNSRNDLNFPAPIPEGKIPSGAILLVGIIVAALIYAIWIYASSGDSTVSRSAPSPAATSVASAPPAQPVRAETSPPVAVETARETMESPAPVKAAESETEEPRVTAPSPVATSSENVSADAETPADTPATAAPSENEPPASPGPETSEPVVPPPPASKTELAIAPPASDPSAGAAREASDRESKVYGRNNAEARIILHAVADSWVEVRDKATDEILFTRVLFKGDSYRVPDREGLSLLTGNAGGLRITVDGKEIAPIGGVGSVRRDFALEPKALIAGN